MEALFAFWSGNPLLRGVQVLLLAAASGLIFLVFFATRDVILRTRSLPYQIMCILLVAGFPVVGFLLYLLIRPARTVAERERDQALRHLLSFLEEKRGGVAQGTMQEALEHTFASAPLREEVRQAEKTGVATGIPA